MLRNVLLSALAAATLAGCATDYAYRGGNGGDYYYGQPRVEYRYYDPYGYGGYGFGGYYYDGYGRLLYGTPYGFYGYPYGYGYGSGWYRPRPHHHGDHEHDDGDDDHHDGDRVDRGPPWRDFGGMKPRPSRTADDNAEDVRPRVRRQAAPLAMPAPRREQRTIESPMPRARSGGEAGGSRMGRVIRNAKTAGE